MMHYRENRPAFSHGGWVPGGVYQERFRRSE